MSFDDINDSTERHERRIVRCRSCNAMIIFLETANGKRMPVNADTVEEDDTEYDSERYESHFATCNKPEQWRKPR